MIYNGFDFSPWLDSRLITRSLMPEYEVETEDVPYRPGEVFRRAKLKPLEIETRVKWKASARDDMAMLRRVIVSKLACFEEAPLYLDDDRHLGIYYMAVLTNPGELENLWYTGYADLEWTAYDPIGYGAEREVAISRDATANPSLVVVGGTWETHPVVSCKPAGNVSSLRITNVDTGEFVQVETSVKSGSPVVFDMWREQTTVDGINSPVAFESDYFTLKPGRNNLLLSNGYGIVSFRERYIG